jgi:tetratricopeptide (TPR) repeat protein
VGNFQRVIDVQPGFYVGSEDLKQTFTKLGRVEEALALAQKQVAFFPNHLLQNPDDTRARILYAHNLVEVGRNADAIREGQAAMEASPGDSVMLYNGACLYARLGETRRAVDTLRQAIDAGVRNFAWMRADPDLDSLRGDSEYIKLTEGQTG